jgi:hypothetical protein
MVRCAKPPQGAPLDPQLCTPHNALAGAVSQGGSERAPLHRRRAVCRTWRDGAGRTILSSARPSRKLLSFLCSCWRRNSARPRRYDAAVSGGAIVHERLVTRNDQFIKLAMHCVMLWGHDNAPTVSAVPGMFQCHRLCTGLSTMCFPSNIASITSATASKAPTGCVQAVSIGTAASGLLVFALRLVIKAIGWEHIPGHTRSCPDLFRQHHCLLRGLSVDVLYGHATPSQVSWRTAVRPCCIGVPPIMHAVICNVQDRHSQT